MKWTIARGGWVIAGRYPSHGMRVTEQTKAIDGVEYELAVRDESAGYFGSWFCRACWKGDVKYDLLPTIDDALAEAGRGAMVHHEAEHQTLTESLTND